MANDYISQITLPNNVTYDFQASYLNKVTRSQVVTGSGTAGSYTNSTYYPAKWTFNTGNTATDGDIITIKIPVAGHDYGVFMSVDNGSHYYPVVLNGTGRITTHYPVNTYLTVIFEPTGSAASMYAVAGQTSSTRITVTGGVWRVLNYYDSNSNDTGYYHRRIYPNLKAGGAIHPYSIIMQLSNGKWSGITTTAPNNPGKSNVSPVATGKVASASGYMLGHVLLMYANATYADTNNIGTYNIWSAHTGLIDARYSFNLANSTGNGFVAYTPVYIVGTVSDGLFHLDATKWWTQTLPSSDDGKVYIYIGDAYDWYRLTFTEDKPMYWYKDGAIRLYSGASEYALDAGTVNGLTVQTAVPSNAIFTDTNKYHKSGSWSDLTYTATAVNGADELKFTIPDNYGDTKNPYGAKAKNLVLAGPSSGNNAAPSFRALVAADIPNSILKWQTTTEESTTLYDFGVYVNMNHANGSSMTGGNYFNILNVPYRKASGNTKADWGWQLGNTTSNDGRLWYRTSGDNVWGEWQTIAHATQSTSDAGSSLQPVYMTKTGVITPITAVGAAYGGTGKTTLKDSANALINALDTGSSDLTSNDYVITQYVGGGTTTTTYHRRPASKVINSTLVKAALGTVSTTAKKFLKDTGDWVQVAYTDLTGVPTSFTPAEHDHNTLYPLKTSTTITKGKATKLTFTGGFQCTVGVTASNSHARAYYKISGYGQSDVRITIFELADSPQVKYYIPDDEEAIVFCNQHANNPQTLFIVMDYGALPTITTDLAIPSSPNYLNHHILTEDNYKSYAWARPSTITADQVLVSSGTAGETTLRAILNNTSAGALGWNNAGNTNADNLRLVDVNTLAYWNGAYSGTSSNLTYYKGGAFGTMAKETATDYAKLASPTFTGTPKAPTAANGTSTTQIATTEFVNNTLAYANAMTFKGTLGTGGTITALPASHNAGDTYRVITAGTWAGKYCEIGTLIICTTDGTAANDAHWTSVETNEDGAVIGPSSSTDNAIVRFDGTTGRIVQNSGVTIDDNNNITTTGSYIESAGGRIQHVQLLPGGAWSNYAADTWYRCCKIASKYNSTNCLIELSGLWSTGAPTMATISITLSSPNITLLHCSRVGIIKLMRLVKDDTDNKYWIDVQLNIQSSGSMGHQTATFIGNVIVSDINTTATAVTDGTAAATLTFATIYNDDTIYKIAPTVNIVNTTASTTTATGALIVSGGVGIGGRTTAQEFNATRTMVVRQGKVYSNISSSNVLIPAKTGMMFANGIAFANPGITPANDVGWIRILGTSESDAVLEIATGDDGDTSTGEKIVVRQYNTSNEVAKEAVLLDKQTGATSFPVSVTSPSFIGALTGNADTATKLAVSKTLWGQSFNGSANVTGDMINVGPSMKLPENQTTFQFLTSGSGAANGQFGRLGLYSTYSNADLTNYVLDVGGKVRIKLPSTATNSKEFIITGSNNNYISLHTSGIQAYNSSNNASLFYLQYYGGNLQIGSSDTATATRTLYGKFDFKSATGFNFSGISAASDNVARYIWFSYNGQKGTPVYDEDFKYNPSTNNLTVGKVNSITLTAATTGFTIAGGSTTSKTLTVNENVTLKAGSSTYLAYYNGNNILQSHSLAHFSDEFGSSVKDKKNELVLGNGTGKASNGSSWGQLALYSSGTKGTYLKTEENSTNWYTATLPAKSGTIAYTSDITDTVANYLKLDGSNSMTGALNVVGSQSSAYNDKGIIFTKGSRIGENASGGLGIYAYERIYLRPDSTTSSSGDGVEISGSGLIPSNNNTESLGDSSHKWANVYATTLAGSVKLVSGNTIIANTANERVSWYEDTVLTGYITIAKRSSNRANMGIHALGNIYIRPGNSSNQLASSGGVVVSHDTLYSGTNEALDLGTSSYQWKDTYSKSFIVDKNITLQYNSTDDSLDFIFA